MRNVLLLLLVPFIGACVTPIQYGSPAEDARLKQFNPNPERAAFYLALRDEAPAQGLETGGSWSRTDPRWAAWDLGWDPGHVQPADCLAAAARRGECPRW